MSALDVAMTLVAQEVPVGFVAAAEDTEERDAASL